MLYLITLSALTSTFGGIVSPICFAVFQIDNELELRRLLDRKISRLGPFQDFVDQNSGAPEGLGLVRSVRHQAAADNIISPSVYHGQPIFCRQIRNRLLIRNKQRAMRHGESVLPLLVASLNASSYLSVLLTSRE